MKPTRLNPFAFNRRSVALITIGSLAALLASPSAQAAAGNSTWNGTTDALWATVTNWASSTLPGTGNTATFNNAGNANTTLDLGAGVTISAVTFDTAAAAGYTIGSGAVGGQTLILNNGGAITMNPSVVNNQLVNAALTLGTDNSVATYTLTNSVSNKSLTLAGALTGSSVAGTAGIKTLAVGAVGSVNVSGAITPGTATSLVLTKSGVGTLTLSGTNTYTGATTINGGTLALDKTASGALAPTSALVLGGGSLSILGAASGTTAQTLAALTVNAGMANSIVINPNGGTSTTLTLSSATVTRAPGSAIIFNTSAGTPSTAVIAWNPALTGGIIGGAFTLTDSGGTGFATVAAGNVTRLTPATILSPTNPTVAGTDLLTNTTGTTTNTVAAALLNSLTIDTSAGSNIWDLVSGNTATVSTGGMLMTGANNFTIQNGTLKSATATNSELIVQQWGTGNLTINSVLANGSGASTLTKLGTGTLTLSGVNTYTGITTLNQGTLALSAGDNRLPTGTTLAFTGNSTLDLGGNSQTLKAITTTSGVLNRTITNGNLTINGDTDTLLQGNDAALVDMSGLTSFTFNKSNRQLLWQPYGTAAVETMDWNLAKTGANTITAATLGIGNGATNAQTNLNARLHLGTTNALNATNFALGGYRSKGTVDFQSGLTSPTLTLRGITAGVSRMTTLQIGNTLAGAGTTGDGVLDLSAGTLDALVTNLNVGFCVQTTGTTSSLTMGGGTVDATTIILAGNGATSTSTAAFNQNAGAVTAGSIIMGSNNGTGLNPTLKPTYKLAGGGTLKTPAITAGQAGSANGASVRKLDWQDGTLTTYDSATDLRIAGRLLNGQLQLALSTAGTHSFNIGTGRTAVVETTAILTGTGTLSKDGGGTLVLSGPGSFTGKTNVTAGKLVLINNDTALGAAPASPVADQLTLNGTTLSLNRGTAAAYTLGSAGSGYTSFPSVALTEVTGETVLATGGVATIAVTTAGTGYTSAPAVTIAPPDLTGGVQATATATVSGGLITGVTVTAAGSGYSTVPLVTISGGAGANGVLTANGVTILGLATMNAGYDFTGTAPSVSFSGGGGSGAAFTATNAGTSGITLAANRGVTLGASGGTIETVADHTIAGIITGPGALTKTGANLLILSGANDFSGAIILTAGTLRANNASSLGSGTATLTLAAAAVLQPNTTLTVARPVSVAGANTQINSLTGSLVTFTGGITRAAGYTPVTNDALKFESAGTSVVTTTAINVPGMQINKGQGGTLELDVAGNTYNRIWNYAGTIKTGVAGALCPTAQFDNRTTGSILDLNGFDQGVASLVGTTSNGLGSSITSTGAAALTVGPPTGTFAYDGTISGAVGITVNGVGTQTLGGPNTYSGDTTVTAGTLSVTANTALPSGTTVRITSSGTPLSLTYASGTDTVSKLYIDGVQQAAGTWGSTSSSATNKRSFITGSGVLNVTSGPVSSSNYASWASANGVTGGPNADSDSDGISNLVEYALLDGTSGSLVGHTLTFYKRPLAVANGDVSYAIETSTDLGVTVPWTVVTPTLDNGTVITYDLTPPTPSKNFSRLKTTLTTP